MSLTITNKSTKKLKRNYKNITAYNTNNMGKLFPAFSKKAGWFLSRQGGIWLRRAHFVRFVSASWRILNFCSCSQDKFVMIVAPGPMTFASQSQGRHTPRLRFASTGQALQISAPLATFYHANSILIPTK